MPSEGFPLIHRARLLIRCGIKNEHTLAWKEGKVILVVCWNVHARLYGCLGWGVAYGVISRRCRGTTVLPRLGLNSFFKIVLGRRDERINNTVTLLSAGQAGGGLGSDRLARFVYSVHVECA